MDRWQRQFQGRCSFVCICCDGPDLAETYAKRLKLTSCYNTVAASQPEWGQLGCSGFIIVDAAGNVTCKSTSSFMEVRQRAFEHVETLVNAMLATSPSASFISPGATMELCGLTARPELNGVRVVCVKSASEASHGGRCEVRTLDGRTMSVKPANLRQRTVAAATPAVVAAANSGGGDGGGGCGPSACESGG
jgi:hypothetical protein